MRIRNQQIVTISAESNWSIKRWATDELFRRPVDVHFPDGMLIVVCNKHCAVVHANNVVWKIEWMILDEWFNFAFRSHLLNLPILAAC